MIYITFPSGLDNLARPNDMNAKGIIIIIGRDKLAGTLVKKENRNADKRDVYGRES